MKIRKKITAWVKQGRKLIGKLMLSAGYFSVDGVRVLHPGLLIDQETAAKSIREAITIVLARAPADKATPLLKRITVRYHGRPVRSGTVWLDHHAAWRGGSPFFDRGIAQINYLSDSWERTTTRAVVALVLSELQAGVEEESDEAPAVH